MPGLLDWSGRWRAARYPERIHGRRALSRLTGNAGQAIAVRPMEIDIREQVFLICFVHLAEYACHHYNRVRLAKKVAHLLFEKINSETGLWRRLEIGDLAAIARRTRQGHCTNRVMKVRIRRAST